jgi:hypothetical protein
VSARGWIGVDLDGTLAEYHGWRGAEHIGAPVPAMLARVREWLAAGQTVKVFTARVHDPAARVHVEAWLASVGLPPLEVTNEKDFGMVELYDDRAWRVETNTGRVIVDHPVSPVAGQWLRVTTPPPEKGLVLLADAEGAYLGTYTSRDDDDVWWIDGFPYVDEPPVAWWYLAPEVPFPAPKVTP